MEKGNKKGHDHIAYFKPEVMPLESAYQECLSELKKFDAGEDYRNFNEFIIEEARCFASEGDGVTYVVWNVFYDESETEIKRDVVSYYTLAATAIPYEDRIRLDEGEAEKLGKEFDIQICGISAVEIKMFAVDKKYQDIFFKYDDMDLPVSAWVIRFIIDFSHLLMNEVFGFKALFLHALPEAESFYKVNGFYPVKVNMHPLHCVDSEYKAMYLALQNVHMNYDN